MKSVVFSVALPAYLLGKDPTCKIICASYSDTIAVKLANDFRSLLSAPWYVRTFGTPNLTKDTEAETTTAVGGFRLTTSVGGSLTGRGGDLIIIDDPLNASDAASKASRERVNDWFKTSVLSRLDDPKRGAIIVVMQRLHVEDLSGVLLALGGWTHLCLPAIAPDDME
ncbi:MAG: phage terminase large subunit, partial [bacterium]